MNHELMTHMLFVDAVVGVGFPHPQVADHAIKSGLATTTWDCVEDEPRPIWTRTALEALDVTTLQELYSALKLHEVTHAS